MAQVFVITGEIGRGKTSFLEQFSRLVERSWTVDGLLCLADDTSRQVGHSSSSYKVKFFDSSTLYPWATKNEMGKGFSLDEETREIVEVKLQKSNKEIIILDDIGPYELGGRGWCHLVKNLLLKDKILILSIKKRLLPEVVDYFKLPVAFVADLDQYDFSYLQQQLFNELKKIDSDKVSLYATISGSFEITLGSTLHALRIPLKGHFLTLIQNFLLILYTKELRGRGLIPISLVSAGLKSFSPMGSKLKPMFYIATQGILYSIPVMLLGVNLLSVILGSLLLGISTIFLSLFLNTLVYGQSYLITLENILHKSLGGFEWGGTLGLWQAISFLVFIKSLIIIMLAFTAYYFHFSKFLTRLKLKVEVKDESSHDLVVPSFTWKESLSLALQDMRLKRFLIPFLFMGLLIYFFSNLSWQGFSFVMVRAVLLSWFGFTLARRINYPTIIKMLNNRGLEHWADSLEKSIRRVYKK